MTFVVVVVVTPQAAGQAGMRVTAQPVHTRGISLVYARSVSPPANGRSGSPVQWVPGWSPHEGKVGRVGRVAWGVPPFFKRSERLTESRNLDLRVQWVPHVHRSNWTSAKGAGE